MEESEIEPNLENPELSRTNTSSEETDSLMNSSISTEEEMITGVDLHLHVGPNASGDLWVLLVSMDGRLLTHKFVREGDYYTGWNSVVFEEPAPDTQPLGLGYMIYVKRQHEHDYPSGNYIFWNSSSPVGPDAYIFGSAGSWQSTIVADFAFKVYKDSNINQTQSLSSHGYAIRTDFWYQEFILHP